MKQYRIKLESQINGDDSNMKSPEEAEAVEKSSLSNESSDRTLEERIQQSASKINEAKRKSARKREFILAELIQTERVYVDDLNTCIRVSFLCKSSKKTLSLIRSKILVKLIILLNVELFNYTNSKPLFLIQCYKRQLETMQDIPASLVGKVDILFSNIEDIYAFHQR